VITKLRPKSTHATVLAFASLDHEDMKSVTTSTAVEFGVARANAIEHALKHPTVDQRKFFRELELKFSANAARYQ